VDPEEVLTRDSEPPDAVLRYAPHADGVVDVYLPAGPSRPRPLVFLVHGGFWRAHWALDLMDDLAIDLAAAGWASWNIEYRRGAGSWHHALDDVAAAVDHLAVIAGERDLAIDRAALVGHSAGGHLVLWAGGRRIHGPVGAATVDPALVVPLAPVADLVDCARRGLGDRAARRSSAPSRVTNRRGTGWPTRCSGSRSGFRP